MNVTNRKSNYKMYKAGKRWLVAAATIAVIGGVGQLQHDASADSTETTATTVMDAKPSSARGSSTEQKATSQASDNRQTVEQDTKQAASSNAQSQTTKNSATDSNFQSNLKISQGIDQQSKQAMNQLQSSAKDSQSSASAKADPKTDTNRTSSASDQKTSQEVSQSANSQASKTLDSVSLLDSSAATSATSANDLVTTNINFSDNQVTTTDNSTQVNGNTVTITQAGNYVITGSATDAQIVVDTASDAVVVLNLDNTNLTNAAGAVVEAKKYGSLAIQVTGTNNLTTSVPINDEETLDTINPNGAIYTNGDVTIGGDGTLNISSTMNGISADGTMNINSGTINVTKSYEALEAEIVNINGGDLNLTSSDDIINAQLDQTKYDAGSTDSQSININGGNLVLHGAGDGLDSNGDINITGGDIVSMIDSTPDNGAIDADGTVTFTGGSILWGGTGTQGTPDSNTSSQSYVKIGAVDAGSTITVSQNGQTLTQFSAPQAASYLNLSIPGITNGQTYQVSVNGTITDVVAGQGGGSGMTAEGGMGGRNRPAMGQNVQGIQQNNQGVSGSQSANQTQASQRPNGSQGSVMADQIRPGRRPNGSQESMMGRPIDANQQQKGLEESMAVNQLGDNGQEPNFSATRNSRVGQPSSQYQEKMNNTDFANHVQQGNGPVINPTASWWQSEASRRQQQTAN